MHVLPLDTFLNPAILAYTLTTYAITMNVLRLPDLAAKLKVSPNTISNWLVERKFIKPFKLGGVNVWDEKDIDDWLLTQKQESKNGNTDKNQAD